MRVDARCLEPLVATLILLDVPDLDVVFVGVPDTMRPLARRRVRVVDRDENPGFWEQYEYDNHGDPQGTGAATRGLRSETMPTYRVVYGDDAQGTHETFHESSTSGDADS
jgi:hypothetical protein